VSATLIIPAYQSSGAIAETIQAARRIPGVSEIIVVDDGSTDDTTARASEAGADTVIQLPKNRGKGGALAAGVSAAIHDHVLFLDADLGLSAADAAPLIAAATNASSPTMVVGVLPKISRRGGFGLALGLARATIKLLTGLTPQAPMSGQRSLPKYIVQHIGLAPRFGVEVGLTVEAAHLGVEIEEVPVPFEHAPTGRTVSGFLHRGRQFIDILLYLLLVAFGIRWPALSHAAAAARLTVAAIAVATLIALGVLSTPPAAALIAMSAAVAAFLWLPVLWLAAVSLNIRRPNHLGRHVPAAAGILFPLVGLFALPHSAAPDPAKWAGVLVLLTFGLLGIIDDLFSAGRHARGLRGHLRSLLAQGKLTTGSIKALGGLGVGLAVGILLDPGRPWLIATDALLIALGANAVNLLDLRPGRALKGFGLLSAICIITSADTLQILGPLLAAAIVTAPADFAGRAMMGDVGSNTLGAVAGLGLVLALSPLDRVAAVLILAALHCVCECWSLTDIIARNRPLSFVDNLGCRHLAPLPNEVEHQ